jgi:TnpA family transposase
MTRLSILSPQKQHEFDAPLKLNLKKRAFFFSLNPETFEFVNSLRTPTTQVGFVLQLGYFRANGKFFTTQQFKTPDINFVMKMLNISPEEINMRTYSHSTLLFHRQKILELLQWHPLNAQNQEKIKKHIEWHIPQQLASKRILYSALEYCCHNKIEIPSYHFLADSITHAYNTIERNLILNVTQKLSATHREKLNQILGLDEIDKTESTPLPSLAYLKKINQSLRPMDIKETGKDFELFRNYFDIFQSILDDLNISDQLTEYFATWVQKATPFQLNQFPDKNKVYLHLLCYIKHQFFLRHDLLIDILLKSTQSGLNSSKRKENNSEAKNRKGRNKAIQEIVSSNENSRDVLEHITAIIQSQEPTSPLEKLTRIETLVKAYNQGMTEDNKIQIVKFEQSLKKIASQQSHFDSLESVSRKIQLRISDLIQYLTFDQSTSNGQLISPIDHFINTEGTVGNNAPRDFLNTQENEMCFIDKKLKVSLYKMLLFIHMAQAIKSGALNLLYSYRYKAVQHYLIDEKTWKADRQDLLKAAGLQEFMDVKTVLSDLKEKLNTKYKIVNERFLTNENPYLHIDEKHHMIIQTPKTDSSDEKYAATLLSQAGYVPIVKILSDIDHITNFTSSFKHHSFKHAKMKPKRETIFAGVIGKGCYMDLNLLAKASLGIKADALNNVVNWHFSLKNISAANNKVTRTISKLHLSKAFQYKIGQLHTSSDGRKVTVAVDSILASHSYKYFGKEKGVTIYMFIDERQILFYSTVISASEREAAYVIDGLLHNDVLKSQIHSTDVHGFTEIIFAITHFIDTLFAPRLKNISTQKLYGFTGRKVYKRMDYKILPSRGTHEKLIEEHWDDILRFMVTIKLKYTPASHLLKRLSSYAREHPLYKALKEFGRIIKSVFLLTYLDDVELRQRIEKQLNKIEFANRFSKAIIGGHKQEFEVGEKEEQEIMAACNILIQNCVNLWNYLYLSQLIANTADPEEQKKMVKGIAKGSSSNWRHINFQGEFDFFKYSDAANQNTFDMEKILALRLTG